MIITYQISHHSIVRYFKPGVLRNAVGDSKVDIFSVALRNTTLNAYIHLSVAYGSDKSLVIMMLSFPGGNEHAL